jgi:hypothetical protein
LEEGELNGELKGVLKGELKILCRQIVKRFGQIPKWVEERLAAQSVAELEALSFRILNAASIEELLQ